MEELKKSTAKILTEEALDEIRNNRAKKINAIWLEVTGCSGNIMSFLNAENPDIGFVLNNLINLAYNNTIMGAEGEFAFEQFLNTLNTEFILLIDGAVSTRDNGVFNIIAKYKGKSYTALEAVKMAGEKAKYVLTVGTCASHGGISAAKPNPAECRSVQEVISRQVIRLPGCPCHPDWLIGTLAHIVSHGMPELDSLSRPTLFYGATIHDSCTRRGYFDKEIFARKPGDKECMFKIGCRGPVTRTDCPRRKWNGYVNWPIGDNTPCIGCAQEGFPDGMEPFVRY